MSILCKSNVNPISFQSQWGCQAVSLGHQSSAHPNLSCTILAPIRCKSDANFVPIPYQSSANPLPLLPILCQCSVIPLQVYCQSIANAIPIHCDVMSIQCQYGAIQDQWVDYLPHPGCRCIANVMPMGQSDVNPLQI